MKVPWYTDSTWCVRLGEKKCDFMGTRENVPIRSVFKEKAFEIKGLSTMFGGAGGSKEYL